MRKILLLLVLSFNSSLSFGQEFSVSGGGAFLADWFGTNNVTSNAIDRDSYYLVDAGNPSDIITTASYDLSAFASAEFSLRVASFGGGTHREANIQFSFDGGSTYTQTEISTTTTGSSYISGGTFTLNSVTNQVVIRISNNGTSGRGIRLRDLVLTGIGTSCFAPSTQATSLAFAAVLSTSATASWIIGGGTNRAVFVRQANTGTASPIDNTTYTANTTFGSGSQIGSTGWYCVFNGTGASVSIIGLVASSDYSVVVVEYNCAVESEKYLAAGVADLFTTATPSSPLITISSATLTSFGDVCLGSNSATSAYTVTGSNLSNDVVLSAPTGFEIRTGAGAFGSSLNLTQSDGNVALTAIDVRFSPSGVSAASGNIEHASTGATSKDVSVSGSGTDGIVVVTTVAASSITNTSALSGGNTLGTSCGTVSAKGVVWGLSANPTIPSINATNDGAGTASYTSTITGLITGSSYNYRSYATNSGGVTSYGSNLTFTTLKSEPTNFPTVFACGTTSTTEIPLSWTGATGAVLPDGYLVKWSATSYAVIIGPADGTAEVNGATTQNVTGTAYTATSLSSATSYFFKIWSYTNSGSEINYKLIGEPQTECATTSGPCQSDNFDLGYGNWTEGSGSYNNSGSGFSGNGVGFNSTNDDIITGTAITGASLVTFNASASSGSANYTMIIQTATASSGPWEDELTLNANGSNSGSVTSSFNSYSISLGSPGNYFVRVLMSARSGGSFYLDNLDIFCSSLPEINLVGNAFSIASNDVTPTTANHTDFGTTAVAGGTVARIFTIQNTGSLGLNLTGVSPYVVVSGTNASEFILTTTPAATIAAAGSTTFEITFDPLVAGLRTASISIANDDADESPFTFSIQGTGVNSNTSDIIESPGFVYSTDHLYNTFQASTITSTANSVGVFRFDIRDGGGSTDADALGTELNSITFSAGTTNIAYIRSAALFDGNTLRNNTPTINTGAGTITFSGLSGDGFSPLDGASLTLTLRVSYLTSVADNAQIQYTISAATANSEGSVFATPNAGGASSITTLDINRIEVTADRLAFSQQPVNTPNNTAMSPSVVVRTVDVNNNLDLDVVLGTVNITSTGTLTGSPVPASISAGVAIFPTLTHTAVGMGFTLGASSTGLTSASSASFEITTIVYVNGDYRTTGSGTWLSNNASPAIWERLTGGVWGASNAPDYNITNSLYVQTGHTITSGGSIGSSVNLKIFDGGTFNCNHISTTASTYIYDGGTLNINASFTIASTGNFDVEDNANVNVNFSYGTPSSSIWQGSENFRPNSNFTFIDWDCANDELVSSNTVITTNTYSGYTAAFGNIVLDFASNLGVSDDWIILSSGISVNLAHGDLIFRTNDVSGADIRLADAGEVLSGIGGDFLVEDSYLSSQVINLKTSGTLTFTVIGDMFLESATTRVHAGSASGASTTLNIDGNLTIDPSAVLEFNSTVSANASSTVNLRGDLTAAAAALLQNSNTSNNGNFNFIGTGDGLSALATQTIDIASTSSNENRNINFNITSGAFVQLISRDFELGRNSGVYVQSGGVFDFGFSGVTPLNVDISGSQTGTVFQSLQGSTLKITSPGGIATSGINNNVRTVPSNRSFNQLATFHYIGSTNQVTGNGITSGSSGKQIIVELLNNSIELGFTNSTGITANEAISISGGKLNILVGRVIETTAAYISGSTGTLYMKPGTFYSVAKGSSSSLESNSDLIPRVDGVFAAYNLEGGTIDFSGIGASDAFQTVRGLRTYKNLLFSGANTYLTDYKNLSNTVTIDSSLQIEGSSVVDCINSSGSAATFSGNGGLIMTGGRIRFLKLNTSQPELEGTAGDYNLTGGNVEFYGTSASENQLLRAADGNSNNISYFNIDINAIGSNNQSGASFYNVSPTASFEVKGALNVNKPAVFRLDEAESVSGVGNIMVNDSSTLLYGSPDGIKLSGAGIDDGNIRISGTRTFSSDASYGFVGNGPMITGNGLPSQLINMYVDKTTAGDIVSLSNDAEVKNILDFKGQGILVTEANLIFISNDATTAIVDGNTSGIDKYVEGRLQWTTDGASSYTFPIGHSSEGAQGFTIDVTGISGSEILGFLETNNTAPIQAYAYCDLETPNGGSGQIGTGTGTPDGVLDQIEFDIESPLQWDITNPGGGITAYDLVVLANGGQDIAPIQSSNAATDIRYLMKNGEPGNTTVSTANGAPAFSVLGFQACPNQYTLSGLTSFSKFTLNGASQTNTTLPVELLYFDAFAMDNQTVNCSWGTSTEINNDFFTLERSVDGVNFEVLGDVRGAGNYSGSLYYEFLDQEAYNGVSYYRLKQTDFDGTTSYSHVIAVNFASANANYTVYPIPFESSLSIVYASDIEVNYLMFDINSRLIRQGSFVSNTVVDVHELAFGAYFIKLSSAESTETIKLLKK